MSSKNPVSEPDKDKPAKNDDDDNVSIHDNDVYELNKKDFDDANNENNENKKDDHHIEKPVDNPDKLAKGAKGVSQPKDTETEKEEQSELTRDTAETALERKNKIEEGIKAYKDEKESVKKSAREKRIEELLKDIPENVSKVSNVSKELVDLIWSDLPDATISFLSKASNNDLNKVGAIVLSDHFISKLYEHYSTNKEFIKYFEEFDKSDKSDKSDKISNFLFVNFFRNFYDANRTEEKEGKVNEIQNKLFDKFINQFKYNKNLEDIKNVNLNPNIKKIIEDNLSLLKANNKIDNGIKSPKDENTNDNKDQYLEDKVINDILVSLKDKLEAKDFLSEIKKKKYLETISEIRECLPVNNETVNNETVNNETVNNENKWSLDEIKEWGTEVAQVLDQVNNKVNISNYNDNINKINIAKQEDGSDMQKIFNENLALLEQRRSQPGFKTNKLINPSNQTGTEKETEKEQVATDILLALKNQIEAYEWKGTFNLFNQGKTTITFGDGETKRVPTNVATIYKKIIDPDKSKSNYEKYREILEIGSKAFDKENPKNLDKNRGQTTRAFYKDLKESFNKLHEEENLSKDYGPKSK